VTPGSVGLAGRGGVGDVVEVGGVVEAVGVVVVGVESSAEAGLSRDAARQASAIKYAALIIK
jgi:hypothetical protein